jgi:tetratricopeptide (TPR) repeat protein
MINRIFSISVCLLLFCIGFTKAFAQPAWTIDLLGKEKKPEKFEERKLGSEKMAEKKFTKFRHVVQNNFTHYNYYYNANNKIKTVLERAKASQKDNFDKLISYYPFSLENTLSQKNELDSVILKATAGILLHDLRNDWIDDMYLLMGKAYYFRKDFDSAAATFQFINYNLFPRKKNEDDSRVIGTNDDANNSRISIANPEKQNILQKLTAKPPSRNDALVWLARTLIEQDELGEAAGIIHTLQNDPNLPVRLVNDLDEINGYLFYKQNMYDSAAAYLEKALSNAETKQDKSRSEFLLGQLFEMTNQYDKASEYYNKAAIHTTDPLIDIYAQLNNAKMRRGDNLKELETGIANLLKLTKKDKFEMYKDVLFYAAGQLAMEKPDTALAVNFYTKSYQFNETNVPYKNKAFLQLANIAYVRKEYKKAFNFYDSLQSGDSSIANLDDIQNRRNALSKIVDQLSIIERQDSLQMVAAMEPAKREAFVKKLSRKMRKERGLKEDENNAGTTDMITFDSKKETVTDLFQSNDKSASDWYFYSASKKAKGFTEFKRKWGTRTNTDNWRRKSAAAAAENNTPQLNANPDDVDASTPANDIAVKNNANKQGNDQTGAQPEDISFEGLMGNLPLTPEQLTASKNLVAVSTYQLGKLFQEELEDYEIAIETYKESLEKFPDSTYGGDIYFNLYYCYYKLGNSEKAAYYKNLLENKFADSKASKLLQNPMAAKPSQKNEAITKQYQDIYNLFIEGKFEEAVAEKQKADSTYGNNYWSPQLLYIEAVYHVKQKDDSAAINVLNNIISMYPKSPLTAKAERMIDVLGRRKEIEEYLTKLEITRAKEDETIVTNNRVAMVRNDSNLIVSPKLFDSSKTATKITDSTFAKTDSLTKAPPVISGPYTFNAAAPHNVIMWLDKVDVTYVNESKNAFVRYVNDNFRASGLTVNKDVIDKDYSLLVFTSFANAEEALLFFTKIKKAAPEEISWLPANKYAFYIIDNDNLERLKNTKDLTGYKNLLNKQYPGFFK